MVENFELGWEILLEVGVDETLLVIFECRLVFFGEFESRGLWGRIKKDIALTDSAGSDAGANECLSLSLDIGGSDLLVELGDMRLVGGDFLLLLDLGHGGGNEAGVVLEWGIVEACLVTSVEELFVDI